MISFSEADNGSNITSEPLGCPSSQEWCTYTPVMMLSQFIIGYVLTAIGYPIGVTLIQTIFSKILGPRPQVSECRNWRRSKNYIFLKFISFRYQFSNPCAIIILLKRVSLIYKINKFWYQYISKYYLL